MNRIRSDSSAIKKRKDNPYEASSVEGIPSVSRWRRFLFLLAVCGVVWHSLLFLFALMGKVQASPSYLVIDYSFLLKWLFDVGNDHSWFLRIPIPLAELVAGVTTLSIAILAMKTIQNRILSMGRRYYIVLKSKSRSKHAVG